MSHHVAFAAISVKRILVQRIRLNIIRQDLMQRMNHAGKLQEISHLEVSTFCGG